MALGGAGCAAAAVASGASAEQDDDIARIRNFTDDVLNRSGTDNSTDLHALGDIARMVDLVNQSGRQTDLVAVRGIAVCGGGAQLALRQLVLERLVQRDGRITGAGDTHCLINIGASGQRVADRTAQTGCRAAERLDLSRVVVGFVLKHQEPRLLLAVDVGIDTDGAGVDLLALVQIAQEAALLEHLGAGGADIHQSNRALGSLFRTVDLDACVQIAVIDLLYHRIFDVCVVDFGQERRVTAVIRPVGVDHADLGDGRIALFLACKVILEELQIVQIHCQTEGGQQLLQSSLVHGDKALDGLDGGRDGVVGIQRLRLVRGCLAGVHRVDQITADLVQILVGQLAAEHVDVRRSDLRTLALRHQLNALCTGVGALVILTRKRLDRQNGIVTFRHGEGLVIANVNHRLGEHNVLRSGIDIRINALNVVAAKLAHGRQRRDLKQAAHVRAKCLGRAVKTRLLFRIAS